MATFVQPVSDDRWVASGRQRQDRSAGIGSCAGLHPVLLLVALAVCCSTARVAGEAEVATAAAEPRTALAELVDRLLASP